MAGQEDDFAEIIRLLKQISEKLDKPCSCGPKDATQDFPNPFSNPIVGFSCPVCKLSSPNNYACMRSDCPTSIRSSVTTGAGFISGLQVSYANGTPMDLKLSNGPPVELMSSNTEIKL